MVYCLHPHAVPVWNIPGYSFYYLGYLFQYNFVMDNYGNAISVDDAYGIEQMMWQD